MQSPARNLSPGLPAAGSLPVRMRILHIAAEPGNQWNLAEALHADSASQVQLEVVCDAEAGLARLREELFDAILLTHAPGGHDALELTEAIRGLGIEEPILVLGDADAGEFAAFVHEVGGDAYLCGPTVTVRTLLWTLGRAIEHHYLVRENRRLALAETNRLHQEQDDAQRLLADQRRLIPSARQVPPELHDHYRQLLRTHVIMGAGNLGEEIRSLAHLLAGGGLTAAEALALHLDAVEELIRGLGNRSARHTMTRADLLALDLLSRLAESYRTA